MATTAIYNMTDTWNNGATTFDAVKMNVTDSASNAASTLINLQVAAASKFSVDKSGVVSALGALLTSASATALAVGLAGSTNPALQVDASTASSATGIKIKSAAAAGGVAVSVVSSGTNENLTIDAKGSGTTVIAGTSTGAITLTRATTASSTLTSTGAFTASSTSALTGAVTAASSVLSTSATAGIGYATGAGGTVTQATNRTTGVTINKVSGNIVLFTTAGSTSYQTFTVTNSAVAAADVVVVSQKSGTDKYATFVSAVAAGSFAITFATTSGTTSEAPVFNFAVIKAVAA